MNKTHKAKLGKTGVISISVLSVIIFIMYYAPSRMLTEFDDSFMYCRYASNYLTGNGFSWNTTDGAAFGATSPAYLFLITTLKSLSRMDNSILLSFTSCSAGLAGLLLLLGAGYIYGKQLAKWHLPLLVIPLCLLSSSFRYHCFTGMETTLAFSSNSLLILVTLLYSRNPAKTTFAALLLSAVFTFMVRPDNGVYSLLFPTLYLLTVKKFSLRNAAIYLISFVAFAGLLLLVYSQLFGSYLPIPLYSKVGDFFIGYAGRANWNVADYQLRFLSDILPFALVVILFVMKKTRVLLSIILPVLITFLFFSRSVQIMGWFARYYFPSIPFLVLAAYITADDQLTSRYTISLKSLAGRAVISFVLFFPVFYTPLREKITDYWQASLPGTKLYSPEAIYVSTSHLPLEVIPWWSAIQYISSVVGDLPDGIKVAATEYGYIASENLHAVIIDMAGLHNMQLAESGFSSGLILSQSPDFIWMPHSDYTYFRTVLLDDSLFHANYHYYPDVFNYGIALRHNSNSFHAMHTTLERVFETAYPGRILADYLGTQIN